MGDAEIQGSSLAFWSMHHRDIDNHPVSTASTQACNRLLNSGTLSEELLSFSNQILTFSCYAGPETITLAPEHTLLHPMLCEAR